MLHSDKFILRSWMRLNSPGVVLICVSKRVSFMTARHSMRQTSDDSRRAGALSLYPRLDGSKPLSGKLSVHLSDN